MTMNIPRSQSWIRDAQIKTLDDLIQDVGLKEYTIKLILEVFQRDNLDYIPANSFIGFFTSCKDIESYFLLEKLGLMFVDLPENPQTDTQIFITIFEWGIRDFIKLVPKEERDISFWSSSEAPIEQEIEIWKYERFDAVKGLVYFKNGQSIEISHNGKETDPYLLMKTVAKNVSKEWWYEDEILDDWNLGDTSDLPPEKVYQAAKSLQKKIASKTPLSDDSFLQTGGKKKMRVNPNCL